MDTIFYCVSALLATLSGAAWMKAASITLPPPLPILYSPQNSETIRQNAKRQGWWNGAAAWLASAAALAQAAATLAHLVR